MSPDADVLARGGIRVDPHGAGDEPVVTITLDRPDTRNAQTLSTWRALRAVGDNLPEGTRVVVLRGAGPVFSSGIDLRSFTPEGVDGESVLTQFLGLDDARAFRQVVADGTQRAPGRQGLRVAGIGAVERDGDHRLATGSVRVDADAPAREDIGVGAHAFFLPRVAPPRPRRVTSASVRMRWTKP